MSLSTASTNRRRFISQAALGAAWIAGVHVAGCGGGSGSASGGSGLSPAMNSFRVRIAWGARSRVVGLSSALSAKITLEKNSDAERDVTFVANRPETAPGEGAVAVYDAPGQASLGRHNLRVEFFGDYNATGPVVGVAATVAEVMSGSTEPLEFTLYSGVSVVKVLPNQRIPLGDSMAPLVEAVNPAGAVVALTPGSIVFEVVGSDASISIANSGSEVRGVAPTRSARIRAKVDGRTSDPQTVAVFSTATLTLDTASPEIGSEQVADIEAVLIGANDARLTWTVEGGAAYGSVTPNGMSARFTAPKVTGSNTRSVLVKATSAWDPNLEAEITIRVVNRVHVQVTPEMVDLAQAGQTKFTATVEGLPSSLASDSPLRVVSWRLVDDGSGLALGTVQPDGTYTAPGRTGSIAVEAYSVYDPTQTARGVVRVLPSTGGGPSGGPGEDGYLVDPSRGTLLTTYLQSSSGPTSIIRNIGFEFPYYGDTKTTVKIARNGFLAFGPTYDEGLPNQLGGQTGQILCFGDNLRPNGYVNQYGSYTGEGFVSETKTDKLYSVTYNVQSDRLGESGLLHKFQICLIGSDLFFRAYKFISGDIILNYFELLASPYDGKVVVGVNPTPGSNLPHFAPSGFPESGLVDETVLGRRPFGLFPDGKQFYLFRWNGSGYDATLERLP